LTVKKLFLSSSMVAISLALTGCGGGGSSAPSVTQPQAPTTPTTPTTPTSTPSEFRTAEYNVDWSLSAIKADEAYAKGFTGDGAIIGFVDYNFQLNNNEIDWHAASVGKGQQWADMYEAYLGHTPTDSQHGHQVASIAAAKKNDFATHGVAFDAEVLAVDFFSGVNLTTQIEGAITYSVSDPYSYLYNNGARVFSKSFGYDEEDFIANPPATNGNTHYVNVNASRFIELGGLVVAAAGNGSDDEPMVSNLETLQDSVNSNWYGGDGFLIIAGSVDENLQISDFSDRAGSAGPPRPIELGGGTYSVDPSQYYMVAPGEQVGVHVPAYASQVGIGDGTSYAAPHISGAAALLFAQWPHLTAVQVANILFDSATDLGAPGVDAVYGHGLLNLDAATEPLGAAYVATGTTSTGASPADSIIVMGSAFGDASPQNLSNIMILDSYNRDFYVDMSSHVINAPHGINFGGLLDLQSQFRETNMRFSARINANLRLDHGGMLETTLSAMPQFVQDSYRPNLSAWHFNGSVNEDLSWSIGQGRQLNSAINMLEENDRDDVTLFVTGYKQHFQGSAGNFYMATSLKTNGDTALSFGLMVGDNQGSERSDLRVFEDDLPSYGLETRFTKYTSKGHFSLGLSALLEKETVLGSRSYAGFKLANQAITGTLSLRGTRYLGDTWSLSSDVSAGLTDVSAPDNSLYQNFNRFTSSQWSLSLMKDGFLGKNDQVGLRVSQPLRVENAQVDVTRAMQFDSKSMVPLFTVDTVNLNPSGREVAVDVGYRLTKQSWKLEANLVHRASAGHIRGLNDNAALLRLSKTF